MDHTKQPAPTPAKPPQATKPAEERGGARRDTDPARYGDWEINGKCVDF